MNSTDSLDLVSVLAAVVVIGGLFCLFINNLCSWLEERKLKKIERELDRKAEATRQLILKIAEDLAASRTEAEKELTRAMFLATRKPKPRNEQTDGSEKSRGTRRPNRTDH